MMPSATPVDKGKESLINLYAASVELRVSVVGLIAERVHHRGSEYTENAQRTLSTE
jgi:hypothetical protein